MKYYKYIAILFGVITIVSMGCEPDDICPESTATTPKIIISFYDVSIPEDKKNVFKFRIQGVDNDIPLTDYNIVTADSIALPLKTDNTTTQFKLHSEYVYDDNDTPDDTGDDTVEGNEDIITINYSTKEVYVSRACGYKTIFENVTLTIEPDADNWIKSKESLNDNQSVEDETSAHFKLFH